MTEHRRVRLRTADVGDEGGDASRLHRAGEQVALGLAGTERPEVGELSRCLVVIASGRRPLS